MDITSIQHGSLFTLEDAKLAVVLLLAGGHAKPHFIRLYRINLPHTLRVVIARRARLYTVSKPE